jgi:hypothetical protein
MSALLLSRCLLGVIPFEKTLLDQLLMNAKSKYELSEITKKQNLFDLTVGYS